MYPKYLSDKAEKIEGHQYEVLQFTTPVGATLFLVLLLPLFFIVVCVFPLLLVVNTL